MREHSKTEIERKICVAISLLRKNDAFLLEKVAHERSITHKLAEYIQVQFPEYHVDCEYNLHGVETKTLPRECNGENKEKVFPDIIIHLRGTDENLLVIEAKPHLNRDRCDQIKLKLFTAKSGKFRYKYGLAIGFSGLAKPDITWFANGSKYRKRDKLKK